MRWIVLSLGAATLACPLAVQAQLQGASAGASGSSAYTREADGTIRLSAYPLESLKRGEEGTVGIRVRLDKHARLLSCQVTKSSGFPLLDAASCDMLIANARMKPFLNADGRKIEKESDGQVVWALPADRKARIEAASAPVGPAPAANAGMIARAGQKVVCRTVLETGSLVKRTKTCLTQAEWKRQYDFARKEGEDMTPKFLPGG